MSFYNLLYFTIEVLETLYSDVFIFSWSLLYFQSLSHCELITDEGLRHLGTSACSSEHLSVLELDNCPLITDQSLDHLITCHSLQRIELYDCQLITRAGIRKLRVCIYFKIILFINNVFKFYCCIEDLLFLVIFTFNVVLFCSSSWC